MRLRLTFDCSLGARGVSALQKLKRCLEVSIRNSYQFSGLGKSNDLGRSKSAGAEACLSSGVCQLHFEPKSIVVSGPCLSVGMLDEACAGVYLSEPTKLVPLLPMSYSWIDLGPIRVDSEDLVCESSQRDGSIDIIIKSSSLISALGLLSDAAARVNKLGQSGKFEACIRLSGSGAPGDAKPHLHFELASRPSRGASGDKPHSSDKPDPNSTLAFSTRIAVTVLGSSAYDLQVDAQGVTQSIMITQWSEPTLVPPDYRVTVRGIESLLCIKDLVSRIGSTSVGIKVVHTVGQSSDNESDQSVAKESIDCLLAFTLDNEQRGISSSVTVNGTSDSCSSGFARLNSGVVLSASSMIALLGPAVMLSSLIAPTAQISAALSDALSGPLRTWDAGQSNAPGSVSNLQASGASALSVTLVVSRGGGYMASFASAGASGAITSCAIVPILRD